MAGLCWVVVTLTLLLSGENSSAAVDKNQLAKITKFIIERYDIKTQVSVAVNIPVKTVNQNYLEEVFKRATAAAVQKKLSEDSVYPNDTSDDRVVVAKPDFKEWYTDHAEALVLQNMKPLVESRDGNFLVFYTFYSPCGAKCTNLKNRNSIIPKINQVFPNWGQFAFVFSKVFDKTSKGVPIDKDEPVESLKQLGNTKVGHDNIFRCYKPKNEAFKCINCFSGKEPVAQCVGNVD
ncbi:uncharacterized protein si:dkey-96g2.1 [Seriola aureovittata]|uniref:uncharacterized protein si:dkey-96g2.1 n=1 Tax=Seriola aureovittata TaxID=2871759 RepID=UPI0024BE00CA|nr:uncharacterized protein si:dkey-96g2.1 [Seriola aureovittata]